MIYHTKCASIAIDIIRLFIFKDEYAKLLSYKNYAEYQAKSQMAKSTSNINKFLTEISNKVNDKFTKEINTIKKIKKAKTNNNNYDDWTTNSTNIASYDIQYYVTKWKKKDGISDKMIREYFPLNNKMNKIFILYEKIFNIKFTKINPDYKWADNISFYMSTDENNKILGYFYIDLYKRDNKPNQTRCFSLQQRSFRIASYFGSYK